MFALIEQFDIIIYSSQLQEMVVEMRSGFTSALQSLSQIQYGDQVLHERVASNKAQYEQQLSDVVGMVLSLKVSVGSRSQSSKSVSGQGYRVQGQCKVKIVGFKVSVMSRS